MHREEFYRYLVFSVLFLLLFFLQMSRALAAPEAGMHLRFHMILSDGKQYTLALTVENAGKVRMTRGYVVVTPVDTRCRVMPSQMLSLPALAAGEKQTVRFPLNVTLHHYRLQMQAFDEEGFDIPFADDNAGVLSERLQAQRDWCRTVRAPV
ncbi:hypothetical protein A2I42_28110 [Salmonella enterica]|uniref:Uncharacterized protein n=1 Tax=Salmonella enterica TaxID=28901 RepID=A0A402WP26_SALER|nr:hypothetical protein [Salmonella enterica]ECG1721205.1 hypothetical protein [Salmonella enterica subsp. diarizonae serovar 17:z10:e,n,x,z15]EHC9775733.1 hypothetical protein [Salmonella enterica subsp. diarizonae serovar 50:z:-]EAA9303529.1 hypothetical protein [Salmonella enterica]EAA9598675.1 hypothetical protein [Salmonella enterica]